MAPAVRPPAAADAGEEKVRMVVRRKRGRPPKRKHHSKVLKGAAGRAVVASPDPPDDELPDDLPDTFKSIRLIKIDSRLPVFQITKAGAYDQGNPYPPTNTSPGAVAGGSLITCRDAPASSCLHLVIPPQEYIDFTSYTHQLRRSLFKQCCNNCQGSQSCQEKGRHKGLAPLLNGLVRENGLDQAPPRKMVLLTIHGPAVIKLRTMEEVVQQAQGPGAKCGHPAFEHYDDADDVKMVHFSVLPAGKTAKDASNDSNSANNANNRNNNGSSGSSTAVASSPSWSDQHQSMQELRQLVTTNQDNGRAANVAASPRVVAAPAPAAAVPAAPAVPNNPEPEPNNNNNPNIPLAMEVEADAQRPPPPRERPDFRAQHLAVLNNALIFGHMNRNNMPLIRHVVQHLAVPQQRRAPGGGAGGGPEGGAAAAAAQVPIINPANILLQIGPGRLEEAFPRLYQLRRAPGGGAGGGPAAGARRPARPPPAPVPPLAPGEGGNAQEVARAMAAAERLGFNERQAILMIRAWDRRRRVEANGNAQIAPHPAANGNLVIAAAQQLEQPANGA